MTVGILGKKLGMTQIFGENGAFIPVTVIEAGPCTVLGVLDNRIRLGFGDRKEKSIPKPELGFYKKINVAPKAFVKEIRFDSVDKISVGQEITTDVFKEKDCVDITGTSIGKGFQGVVKRHHFRGGPGGHGSMFHRAPGAIGSRAGGGRGCRKGVRKGKRFPGRMGGQTKTVQNLEVLKVYKEKNLILVKGPVPGTDNSYLEIKTAKKKTFAKPKQIVKPKEEAKKKEEKPKK